MYVSTATCLNVNSSSLNDSFVFVCVLNYCKMLGFLVGRFLQKICRRMALLSIRIRGVNRGAVRSTSHRSDCTPGCNELSSPTSFPSALQPPCPPPSITPPLTFQLPSPPSLHLIFLSIFYITHISAHVFHYIMVFTLHYLTQ